METKYTVIDHGVWEKYEPEIFPVGYPEGTMFARRLSDGKDWYEFQRDPASWTTGSVRATCLVLPEGDMVGSVVWDASRLFPAGNRLIEILGLDPEEKKPWKGFELRYVNVKDGTFSLPPERMILSVSAAQAKTALYNAKLLPKVKELVAAHPYEPVRIFYESANNWLRESPYTLAIAAELDLSTTEVDALFKAAAKL